MNETNWKTARAIRVDGDVFTQDSEGWWLDANMEDSVGDRVLEGRDITVIIDAEGRNVEAGAVELGYQISESKLLDEARRELAEEKAGRLTWQERAEELDAALTAAQARAGDAEAELAREIEIRDGENGQWRDIYLQARREREEARAEVARLKADCNTRADAWTQGWSAGLADSTCSHPTALTPNPYRARADGEAGS